MEKGLLLLCFLFLGLFSAAQDPSVDFSGGSGTAADPYRIGTRQELERLHHYLGEAHRDKHFRLTADIDLGPALNGAGRWIPIGNNVLNHLDDGFRGKLHGGGKKILNLYIDAEADNLDDDIGLFERLDGGAWIDSLHICGGEVKGGESTNYIGALAGTTTFRFRAGVPYGMSDSMIIRYCTNSASVVSDKATYTGGLIGVLSNGGNRTLPGGFLKLVLHACRNTGNVTGYMVTGGIVGNFFVVSGYDNDYPFTTSVVSMCSNSGTVTSGYDAGGLCGYVDVGGEKINVLLQDCSNSGAVSGRREVGGLLGRASRSLNHCYNTGSVTGSGDYIGGLVGLQDYNLSILNSFNKADVTGADSQDGELAVSNYVGGIIGDTDADATFTLSNSYNTGNVRASDWVGGLAGNLISGTITNCYNAGGVSGYNNTGGICGQRTGGGVTYSYWRTDGEGGIEKGVSGSTLASNSQGKTTDELQSLDLILLLNNRVSAMNGQLSYFYWGPDNDSINKGFPLYGGASVNFDLNGEGAVLTTPGFEVVAVGGTVTTLPEPTREGYVFGGWNTKSDGTGEAFTTQTPVNEQISVYAFWRKIVELRSLPNVSVTYNGTADIDLTHYNWGYIDNLESGYSNVSVRAVSAVFDDENAGTEKTITVEYELYKEDSLRYIIYPQTLTGEIKPLKLTHDINVANTKVYDGTDTTTYTGGLTNVIEGDDITLNAEFKYDSAGVATATAIGTTVWSISGNDTANYALPEFPSRSAYITRLALTHNVTADSTKVYDGTDDAAYTGSLTNVVEGDSVNLNAILYYYNGANVQTGGSIRAKEWAISGANAGNYSLPSFEAQTASITPAPQAIEFMPDTLLNLSDENYTLEATVSSGLTARFKITKGDSLATVYGNTLTLSGAGKIEVTAYVEPNTNYETADEIAVTVTIQGNTGVNSPETDKFKVWTANEQLVVEGITSGDNLAIYAPNGTVIYQATATENRHAVKLPCRGVYIVLVNKQSMKIVY